MFLTNKKQTISVAKYLFNSFGFEEVILFDAVGNLTWLNTSIKLDKDNFATQSSDITEALRSVKNYRGNQKKVIILNGLAYILNKLVLNSEEFYNIVEDSQENIQFILLDVLTNVGGNFSPITVATKENLDFLLFGGGLQNQNLVESDTNLRQYKLKSYELMYLCDEQLSTIVLPIQEDINE